MTAGYSLNGNACQEGTFTKVGCRTRAIVCYCQKVEGLMQMWLHLKQNRPELYLAPDTILGLAPKTACC